MKKKILLAFVATITNTALADVTVTFKGSSTFQAGARSVDKNHKETFSYSPNQKSTAFYTKQQASLQAEGKKDSLTYGAILRLQTTANIDNGSGDFTNNRSYVYLETNAGAFQLGSNFAASKMLKIDAGTIASASGGVDGDWGNFANIGSVITENFAIKGYNNIDNVKWNGSQVQLTNSDSSANIDSSLVIQGVDTLSNRMDSGENSRKITYLSPRISGLQVAVSFIPDINNNDESDLIHSSDINSNGLVSSEDLLYMGAPVKVKNLWSIGLNYNYTFNDITFGFSAVGDRGTATNQFVSFTANDNIQYTNKAIEFEDLKTYAIGTSISAYGFTVAGSYQNDGNSLAIKGQDKFKASWWTSGIAYAQDDFSTSISYLDGKKGTETQNVKTKLYSWGADYQLAPGIKPFSEVTIIKMKPKSTNLTDSELKSTIFMLGMILKF